MPAGHWETSTLVHAIGIDGTRAAMVLDGPLNTVSFNGFCEWLLAPAINPGNIVIMDNLSSHKSVTAVSTIESAGAHVVYLPPYSPDLNPIEMVFSKLKQIIRALRPRAFSDIVVATRNALRKLTPADLDGFFNHCGYLTT